MVLTDKLAHHWPCTVSTVQGKKEGGGGGISFKSYRDSYRNFGLGGGGGGGRDQVHAGGGGGGGGVLCDIPPQKKRARIAIEGPDLSAVNFDEVLDIFKQREQANQIVDCIAVSES